MAPAQSGNASLFGEMATTSAQNGAGPEEPALASTIIVRHSNLLRSYPIAQPRRRPRPCSRQTQTIAADLTSAKTNRRSSQLATFTFSEPDPRSAAPYSHYKNIVQL